MPEPAIASIMPQDHPPSRGATPAPPTAGEAEVRRLRRVVEQSPTMVLLVSPEGEVEYVNPRYCATTGFSATELVGRPLAELVADESRRELYPRMWGAVERGVQWHGDLRLRQRSGDALWASFAISPVKDAEGRITDAVAIAQDIGEVKEAKARLEKANAELKRLSDLKSAFVSTVSHELRTPLTAIKNALDILAGADDPEARGRFVELASRNVTRLTALVNDLLDLSRIESGRLPFRFAEVEVAPLLRELAETFQPQADSFGIDLQLVCADGLSPLWGDPERLRQVLTNLVGNALKFTPRGGHVRLSAERDGEGVRLAVEDDGPGMGAADQRRIFEPFYQVSGKSTAGVNGGIKGSGLGLSIARDLVARHGGELRLASAPGEGSRFWFVLPRSGPAAREISDLEEEVLGYREYPFFGLLTVEPRELPEDTAAAGRELEALAERLRGMLPRPSDHLRVLPAHRRLAIFFLATDRAGTQVVKGRLERRLAEEDGPQPRLHGPAAYPEDGTTAHGLLAQAEKDD